MDKERKLGGVHPARFEHGCIDVAYIGDVSADAARDLIRAATDWTTGAHSVWVSDITRLSTFTPEARKVFSSMGGDTNADTHIYVFFAGATIKTKAVLSLVFTATRLMGRARYHVTYCDDVATARAQAHAKYDELVAAGSIAPSGSA